MPYYKPKSEDEAYLWGEDDAEGRHCPTLWPSHADLEHPGNLELAYMRGFSDAMRNMHRNDSAGCMA